MPEEAEDNKKVANDQPESWSVEDLNEEARRNLFGFFELLIKVDKRVNPHLYKNDHH